MTHHYRKKSQSFEKKMKEIENAIQFNPALSAREKEILIHVIQEKSNLEIADNLQISIRTVENHKSNILRKLNCKSIVGVVVQLLKG